MIKNKALKWLVENVTKWPTITGGIVSTPNGWSWGKNTDGDIWLFADIPTEMYVDSHIEQREWLDYIGESLVEQPMSPLGIYYIAGPMTGLPDFNRANFNRIASELDGVILNPATLPDGLSHVQYMSICLPMVQCATHMYMLEGWEKSPGALAEHALAVKLKMVISYE